MAAGDLISSDWQAEFRGLLMGTDTNYHLVSVDGLGDLPDLTTADRERLRRHGLVAGDDFLKGRSMTLELDVSGSATTSHQDALDALLAALVPGEDEAPLVLNLPTMYGGVPVQVNARPRDRSLPITYAHSMGMTTIKANFFATDPRIYANAGSSYTVTLPSTGGGLNFNATFNASFGAISSGGAIEAVNDGNFTTPVTYRIDGPCTDPRIENLSTGELMTFSITIDSGDYLLIDTETRSVLLNGTASRFSTKTSSNWIELAPGTNSITFRAATTTSATMTVSYRSAWV